MRIFNYGVTLTKKETEKLEDVIADRDRLLEAFSKMKPSLASLGETIIKLLDIYEDPETSEDERKLALYGIRYVANEFKNILTDEA